MHTASRNPATIGLSLALSFAAASFASSAAAADGDGVGLGPVFAYGSDRSIHLGWELAGSNYLAFGRGSLGGSYRVNHPPEAGPAYFHYLAWEPWLYVGGTLGLALNEKAEPRAVFGLWEALPMAIGAPHLFESDEALIWVFSVAFGWRMIGATHQFYLTPKLWRMRGFDFFS